MLNYLQQHFAKAENDTYIGKNITVRHLLSGVGLPQTAYRLGANLRRDQTDFALQVGIAGSYNRAWQLGTVVNVTTECFADVGITERDGSFTDVFELGLTDRNEYPYQNGLLVNAPATEFSFLPVAHGLSVNKVNGTAADIAQIGTKYPTADIETMEGASFAYACLMQHIPFVQLRGISNYVEPRNRAAWNIPLAIDKVNEAAIALLQSLSV